jgi:hypothetical protein
MFPVQVVDFLERWDPEVRVKLQLIEKPIGAGLRHTNANEVRSLKL